MNNKIEQYLNELTKEYENLEQVTDYVVFSYKFSKMKEIIEALIPYAAKTELSKVLGIIEE